MHPLAFPFFLFTICILAPMDAAATLIDTLPGKKRFSTIRYENGSKIKGHIFSVNDSSIIVIKRENMNSRLNQQYSIPAEQIKLIERKQKGDLSVAASMGLGLLVGSIMGFSIGLSDCDDPNEECGFFARLFETNDFKAAWILSITLGGAGLIGGIFSNKKKKKKFIVNGRRPNLVQHKLDLLYY